MAINKSVNGENDEQESSNEENGPQNIFDESNKSEEQLFGQVQFLLKNRKPR